MSRIVYGWLTALVSGLPLPLGYFLADALTELHFRLFPARRHAALANLAVMLPHRFEVSKALEVLDRLQRSLANGVWLAASLLYRGDDRRRLARLHRAATMATRFPVERRFIPDIMPERPGIIKF